MKKSTFAIIIALVAALCVRRHRYRCRPRNHGHRRCHCQRHYRYQYRCRSCRRRRCRRHPTAIPSGASALMPCAALPMRKTLFRMRF